MPGDPGYNDAPPHIRRHPDPLVAPWLFSVRAFRAGAAGLVIYYTGFAVMLLGATLLLTVQWHFPVLLAAAGSRPAYAAVVLPSMLLWGIANALIQPSLFASADADPRAYLTSGSAVMATARQLGSALGVAIFVAVFGTRPAGDRAGFDRAWIIVLISAAVTALAGLATGRRLIRARDTAQTAGDASPARSYRRRTPASAARRSALRWIPAWPRSDRGPVADRCLRQAARRWCCATGRRC